MRTVTSASILTVISITVGTALHFNMRQSATACRKRTAADILAGGFWGTLHALFDAPLLLALPFDTPTGRADFRRAFLHRRDPGSRGKARRIGDRQCNLPECPSLPNPLNDAAEIAALFRSAGFTSVDIRRDLGIAEMRRAISDFAEAAGDVDVAVIYFAGHGIEVDGSNYIIPVDARLLRDFDIEDETVSVERILKSIEPARKFGSSSSMPAGTILS
jgi:Caspase domain